MKKYLLGFLLFGSIVLSSCIKDEDGVVLSNDCYIVEFTLGTISQVLPIKASDGSDSTYTISIDGAYFPMTIDHRNQLIENRDSLPYNAKVDGLLATVGYSGAMLSYRDAEAQGDSAWTAYSTSDTINFSRPLHFSVMAPDGETFRIYTVKVNVHQQEGDSLYWNRSDSIVPALDAMTEMKSVALQGKLLVLGRTADGVNAAIRNGLGVNGEWEQQMTSLPADADLSTLRTKDETAYMTSASGQLYASTDGLQWEALGQRREGMTLAAVSDSYFYAMIDGKLYRSADAEEWQEESLDEDAANLPQYGIQSVNYTQKNGAKRLFVAGASAKEDAPTCLSWSKMWRYDSVEDDTMWMFFNPSADNSYYFPLLEHQSLFQYDGRLMTFGGKRLDKEGKSMSCLYVSNDNGITWKADLNLHLPFELSGVEGPLAATVDANNYIWIIANKQVWRGRLNRLGFVQR